MTPNWLSSNCHVKTVLSQLLSSIRHSIPLDHIKELPLSLSIQLNSLHSLVSQFHIQAGESRISCSLGVNSSMGNSQASILTTPNPVPHHQITPQTFLQASVHNTARKHCVFLTVSYESKTALKVTFTSLWCRVAWGHGQFSIPLENIPSFHSLIMTCIVF